MRPGPRIATKLLNGFLRIDDPPRASVEVLTSIIEAQGWGSSVEPARELAERWDELFRTYLRSDLSELNRIGRHCCFAFNSSSEYLIQGAAFIEPGDSESLQDEKSRRKLFTPYIEALRQLTDRQLELVSAGVLQVLGAHSPVVTKFSGDRGVDFFGRLKLESLLFANDGVVGWHRQMEAWLIGQAKHYVDTVVRTPALRDLIGTVTMLRSALADRRQYPDLVIRTCDSVFHVLLTTGRLSAEVWKDIERHGAIGIDGEMLASFLAVRGVATTDENTFDHDRFMAWLNSFESFRFILPAAAADDEDQEQIAQSSTV